MPKQGEWIHEFFWKIHDKNELLRFIKLRILPDMNNYMIHNIRTNDDVIISIEVMVFYELVDINKHLNNTHDPNTDILKFLTSDLMDFTSEKTFEKFKNNTILLSNKQQYPQMLKNIQDMHDSSIQLRTSLLLKSDNVSQEQDLKDLEVKRDNLRE